MILNVLTKNQEDRIAKVAKKTSYTQDQLIQFVMVRGFVHLENLTETNNEWHLWEDYFQSADGITPNPHPQQVIRCDTEHVILPPNSYEMPRTER